MIDAEVMGYDDTVIRTPTGQLWMYRRRQYDNAHADWQPAWGDLGKEREAFRYESALWDEAGNTWVFDDPALPSVVDTALREWVTMQVLSKQLVRRLSVQGDKG